MTFTNENPRWKAFVETRNRGTNAIHDHKPRSMHLHLWETCHFTDPVAWTVFYQGPDQPYVRETRWDKQFDYDRFLTEIIVRSWDTTPQIVTRETALDVDQFQAKLEQGRTIVVPVIAISGHFELIVLDGITYGLEMPFRLGKLELSWWSDGSAIDGPPKLQPLIQWFHGMVSFLTQCLDQAEKG